MPEGPEIRRAADKIENAIRDQPLRRVFFAFEHLKVHEAAMAGSTVTAIETRGKAMLTHFGNGLSVYTHNQLYGRWYVSKPDQLPSIARSLRFAVHGTRADVLLYSASDIEVWPTSEIDQHPFLRKLGPDALDLRLDESTVVERLLDVRFSRRRLSALLLDQSFLAGLGNYLRSEILHAARLLPDRQSRQLTVDERAALAQACLHITRRSYQSGGITNDATLVKTLKLAGKSRSNYRFAVFGRDGLPCYACHTLILRADIGRRIYWCPRCQT